MPEGWGVSVTLESLEGEPLTEYGKSSIRGRLVPKDRILNTKVEAKTNQKFRFCIKGTGPFLNFDTSEVRPPLTVFGSPPYALTMDVFIDGNKLPGSLLIELSPKRIVMTKGLSIDDWNIRSGTNDRGDDLYRPHNWVFTDVGIDVRLAQLGLLDSAGGDEETSPDSDTGAAHEDTEGPNGKIGTIEVRLTRYIVRHEPHADSSDCIDPRLSKLEESSGKAGEEESGDGDGAMDSLRPTATSESSKKPSPESTDVPGSNVTHQIELVDEGKKEITWPIVGGYHPDGHVPYASFRFQYMSLSKLVKLGVANEDGSKVTPAQKRAREREAALAATRSSSAQKSKRKAAEEGERVQVMAPTSESKRSKPNISHSASAEGRSMMIPFRPKATPQRHWLRSSKQELAKMEPASDADEGDGKDKGLEARMALTSLEDDGHSPGQQVAVLSSNEGGGRM